MSAAPRSITVLLVRNGHDAEHLGLTTTEGTQREVNRHQEKQPTGNVFLWSIPAMMPNITSLATTKGNTARTAEATVLLQFVIELYR